MCQNGFKKCEVCGNEITKATVNPLSGQLRIKNRKFCSLKCCHIARSFRDEKNGIINESLLCLDGTRKTANCKKCGMPFERTTANRKYCNKHLTTPYTVKEKELKCKRCGNVFFAKSRNKKYCSGNCLVADSMEKKSQIKGTSYVEGQGFKGRGVCLECGKETVFIKGKKVFCSKRCKNSFLRKTDRGKINQKRAAAKYYQKNRERILKKKAKECRKKKQKANKEVSQNVPK